MTASSGPNIHRTIVDFADDGRDFAVATVLSAEGSTPREAGTKAVIEADGTIHGTVGGGRVEGDVQGRAAEVIESGLPLILDFELEGHRTASIHPICGGNMRILIDPTAHTHRDAYAHAVEAEENRGRGVLLTSIRRHSEPEVSVRWVPEDAEPPDLDFPSAEAIRDAPADETPALMVRDGGEPVASQQEVLVEPLVLPPLLLVAGGGHVGRAVAIQADLVGFAVTVIDDREEFTEASRYPADVDTRCGDIAGELSDSTFGDDVYVAIVTRGHQHDRAALAACIDKPCAYIGMMGSTRKIGMVRKAMLDAGEATEEELDRVYAPIGLDIGAETVPELATSIVSQLVAVRRKGTAPRIPLK